MRHVVLLALSALTPLASALAAPYRPASDSEILERLPGRLLGSEQQALRELRSRLREKPTDAALAALLAERYYQLAQRSGDPRYIGYAQSVLAPWPPGTAAPPSIRTVRAEVAQFLHDFPAALADLDAVLDHHPGDGDARSIRAIIHLVKADYGRALSDCRALEQAFSGLIASACAPTVEAASGHGAASLATFSRLLAQYPAAPANERRWVHNRMAEISQRLGRPGDAEAHYQAALQIGPPDQYLLAAYAEFLLDEERPAEVLPLLAPHAQNEVLLLRLALASKALGRPETAAQRAALADRYEASRRRGDRLHLADEAIFALNFADDPVTALRLARENWAALQREPGDARILLEAALARQDIAAAQPVLDWLRESGLEDRKLRWLADQLTRSGTRQP